MIALSAPGLSRDGVARRDDGETHGRIDDVAAYPLDYVAVLVEVEDTGRLVYRGTAFPCLREGIWLTARHCLDAWRGPQTAALIYKTAGTSFQASVVAVDRHPFLDIAVLRAEHDPVPGFSIGRATWGNEVSVIGYPEDLFLDRQGLDRPRVRLLKGHIQRVEPPSDEADCEGDFELSFACPGGLSGSPVVAQVGQAVVGVVTGNRESFVVTDSEEVTPGKIYEIRQAVSFGAAVDLARATAWLEERLA